MSCFAHSFSQLNVSTGGIALKDASLLWQEFLSSCGHIFHTQSLAGVHVRVCVCACVCMCMYVCAHVHVGPQDLLPFSEDEIMP